MFHDPSFSRPKVRRLALSGCTAVLCLLCCLAPDAASQPNPAKLLQSLTSQKSSEPTATPATAPPPASAPAPADIPLPDVTSRAEDLKRLLRTVSDQLPTRQQLEEMQDNLNGRDEELNAKHREVQELLGGNPNSLEVHEEQSYWRSIEAECADSRQQLLGWAKAAQAATQQLQAQLPIWSRTLEENRSTPDLGPVLDVITQSVADIQALNTQAQSQLRSIVNLQVQAAQQDQTALDVLDQLTKAQSQLNHSLFQRDSLPLWQVAARREQGEPVDLYKSASTRVLSIRSFARQRNGGLAVLILLLFLSLFGAYRLHVAAREFQPENEAQSQALRITHHWFALGLLLPLLFSFALAPSAPVPLIGLIILASFVPILILLPPLIPKPLRILLYCVSGVYFLNALVSWASFSTVHKREVQVLGNLIVFAIFASLIRPSRLKEIKASSSPRRFSVFAIRLAILLLGVAMVANLLGYARLAQYLSLVVVYSTFIALCIATAVRVLTLLLAAFLGTSAGDQLAVVRLHREGIARWGPRLLHWTGIVLWLAATLGLLGVRDWISQKTDAVLDFRIAGGGSGVTLGGVLGFFFILVVGYAFSTVLRFLVREELLKRFRLSRGLPELISSTLHYFLLLLVFFYAVNKGGIELNKFTLLTGALGVGVGFGLQNIVNNFVSGLILQFERPIHIGDVLDMDGVTGKVTRIGIRSSTILTFQGAEVILPNANFISGKVVNWTLSEAKRRMELALGVAYGSDTRLASQLLLEAATIHESVLTDPPPAVYFKEFGESSLNFELQFWVMQQSNTVKVKSEVALALMKSLAEAGIEIPFPQRDLRLRSVAPEARAELTGDDVMRPEPESAVGKTRRASG